MAEISNPSDTENDANVIVTRRRSSITNKLVKEENQSPNRRKRDRRSTLAPQLSKSSEPPRKRGRPKKLCPSRPTYAMMRERLHSKWERGRYGKIPVDKQDKSIVDLKVDVEVATRSSEGHQHWDSLTQKIGEKEQYEIDYIINSVCRELGRPLSEKVLIKWTKYPRPTWESTRTIRDGTEALEMFKCRQEDLDFIELRLRTLLGEEVFDRLFPNRYLKYEAGVGNGGYVQNKRSIYANILRSIEWRWNHVNRLSGQPLLYIEDWTTEPEDAESLTKFLFTNFLSDSADVKEILKFCNNQLAHKKCVGENCSTCMVQSKEGSEDSHCCGMNYALDVDEDGQLKWDDKMARRANFECTSECECGPKCRNQMLTKGRQSVLCVFRESEKGWGVRTVEELPSCSFVTEYAGEMCLKEIPESDPKWIYDILLQFDVRDNTGKKVHDPLVIASGNKGNESRFFNHSCEPNMRADTFIIERHGIWYNHMGFFTTKKIDAGEELTFDYFPERDGKTPGRPMFTICRCNSEKCRFKTPLIVREPKKPLGKWLKIKKPLEKRTKLKMPLKKRMEMRKMMRHLLSALAPALPIRKTSMITEVEMESIEEEVEEEMRETVMEEVESEEEREENEQPMGVFHSRSSSIF